MKKLAALLVLLLAVLTALAALDFTEVDNLYDQATNYQKVYDDLKAMLTTAKDGKEKSEVLWRLSRVCVDLGDALPEKDKKGKYAIYEEGQAFAEQSIAASPNWMAYLWKSANVGRYGQTKGVLSSLAKVGPMRADIKVIIDDFNVLDSSEAWYTLGVLFDKVPTLSSVKAVSYMRAACDTIPAKYIYGGTYKALAEMLYDRNWSAAKREKEIAGIQKDWNNETKSNNEKYAFYEGAKGVDATPLWSKNKLSAMSDREEALEVLKYAQEVYKSRAEHTKGDDEHNAEIQELISKWSK